MDLYKIWKMKKKNMFLNFNIDIYKNKKIADTKLVSAFFARLINYIIF